KKTPASRIYGVLTAVWPCVTTQTETPTTKVPKLNLKKQKRHMKCFPTLINAPHTIVLAMQAWAGKAVLEAKVAQAAQVLVIFLATFSAIFLVVPAVDAVVGLAEVQICAMA